MVKNETTKAGAKNMKQYTEKETIYSATCPYNGLVQKRKSFRLYTHAVAVKTDPAVWKHQIPIGNASIWSFHGNETAARKQASANFSRGGIIDCCVVPVTIDAIKA